MISLFKGARLFSYVLLCLFSSCSWFKNEAENEKKQVTPIATATPSSSQPSPYIVPITSRELFEKIILQSPRPSVVKFEASWCNYCKQMQPIFEELAEEFKEKYTFATVNVDELKDLVAEYNIKGIPTFMFFLDGKERNKEIRVVGLISKELFRTHVNDYLH